MATKAFTGIAEIDIEHQLDRMAGVLDRSRDYLVNQALREYLKTHAWQMEKINQGIATADRGELADHVDVMREMEDLIEQKIKGRARNSSGPNLLDKIYATSFLISPKKIPMKPKDYWLK